MEIEYQRGVVVTSGNHKLFLDPEIANLPLKHSNLVTHAHSDHTAAVSGSAKTYLTETTINLYKASTSRNPRNFSYINFNEPFEIGPFEIEFIPAGHLLGAAQIIIREGNQTFHYTGDFCPEDLLTVKGAKMPGEEVDVTLLDTTYGNQMINFDSREQSRKQLFLWVMNKLKASKIPILNIGHLGGAQEVITLFNQLATNLPIIVDTKIKRVNQVYENQGIKLNYITIDDRDVKSVIDDKCLILTPRSTKKLEIDSLIKKYPNIKDKLERAIVTGQTAKYGFKTFSYASPLSTHANFKELIETINKIAPYQVLTHYGYHQEFAHHLSNDFNIAASSFENCGTIDCQQMKEMEKIQIINNENLFNNQSRLVDDYF